ncbi:MAG: hypothetical protein ACJASQ_000062 [Crocinitomicaceae bacterium]|jgi:hypothetical protein
MKYYIEMRNTLYFVVMGLFLLVLACCTSNTQTNSEFYSSAAITEVEALDSSQLSKKHDYQLADELVDSLLKTNTDTVLFYKRICINCCEYYNVFWTNNGKRYLHKFYFDFSDMQNHSVRIELMNNRIFPALKSSYVKLHKTAIQENMHKMKDGTSSTLLLSHYCYSSISLYSQNDSVISNQIKDNYFKISFTDENDVLLPNDNYQENINSEWYTLLSLIEKDISSMDETSDKELEIMRVVK